MLTRVKFKAKHIGPVLADFREADRQEVWASGRQTPEEALRTSVEASSQYCQTFLWNGVPVAICGMSSNSVWGVPWMLATESITEWGKPFIKEGIIVVDEMLKIRRQLTNYIDSRNTKSIKWLQFIGFTVAFDAPQMVNGEIFYRFWRLT